MDPAPGNPLTPVFAQVGEFIVRRVLQPHTTAFNLTVAAVAGLITVIFGTIIILVVLVAANCNILNYIE